MFRCEWRCSFAPSLKSLEPQEVISMHFSPFVGRDSWVLCVDGCVFICLKFWSSPVDTDSLRVSWMSPGSTIQTVQFGFKGNSVKIYSLFSVYHLWGKNKTSHTNPFLRRGPEYKGNSAFTLPPWRTSCSLVLTTSEIVSSQTIPHLFKAADFTGNPSLLILQ